MESYFVIQKNRICFRKICPRLVSVSYLSEKKYKYGSPKSVARGSQWKQKKFK